jgi:hypothetical protein
MPRWAWVILAVLLVGTAARAEGVPKFFLMTIGPGDDVYEVFGHNAIVRVEADGGGESAYNWGVFDFDQPNFVGRFLMGRMLYRMERLDLAGSIEHYRSTNRAVRITELLLTEEQARRLAAYCDANDTDASREYRYDYFLDNCSTRVRDAIDHGLGGEVRRRLVGASTGGQTFRSQADRLVSTTPWAAVGLAYALGRPTDRVLDRWEESFIPMRLEASLREIPGVLGRDVFVLQSSRAPEPTAALRWWPAALGAGVAVGGLGVLLASRRRKLFRSLAVVGVVLWSLCAGLVGLGLAAVMLLTDHAATRWNISILQIGPQSLPLVWAGVVLLRGKSWRFTGLAAAIPVGVALAGVVIGFVPGTSVTNPGIVMAALTLHLGAWLVMRLAGRAALPK